VNDFKRRAIRHDYPKNPISKIFALAYSAGAVSTAFPGSMFNGGELYDLSEWWKTQTERACDDELVRDSRLRLLPDFQGNGGGSRHKSNSYCFLIKLRRIRSHLCRSSRHGLRLVRLCFADRSLFLTCSRAYGCECNGEARYLPRYTVAEPGAS
jgi:hypothetical protein